MNTQKTFLKLEDDCDAPDIIVSVRRKTLVNMWALLLRVDFEQRDDRWEQAAYDVKQLLKQRKHTI